MTWNAFVHNGMHYTRCYMISGADGQRCEWSEALARPGRPAPWLGSACWPRARECTSALSEYEYLVPHPAFGDRAEMASLAAFRYRWFALRSTARVLSANLRCLQDSSKQWVESADRHNRRQRDGGAENAGVEKQER